MLSARGRRQAHRRRTLFLIAWTADLNPLNDITVSTSVSAGGRIVKCLVRVGVSKVCENNVDLEARFEIGARLVPRHDSSPPS